MAERDVKEIKKLLELTERELTEVGGAGGTWSFDDDIGRWDVSSVTTMGSLGRDVIKKGGRD